jgi:hypothetical protein
LPPRFNERYIFITIFTTSFLLSMLKRNAYPRSNNVNSSEATPDTSIAPLDRALIATGYWFLYLNLDLKILPGL